MDIEQKQEELIEHFLKQANNLRGSLLAPVIVDATSHPSLFAFSKILVVPNVIELHGTGHAMYSDLLRLFAYGTWSDYKSNAGSLPDLTPEQVLKLKQLTVLTLAGSSKVLLYDQLMQELDIENVRELEDFLINECMYAEPQPRVTKRKASTQPLGLMIKVKPQAKKAKLEPPSSGKPNGDGGVVQAPNTANTTTEANAVRSLQSVNNTGPLSPPPTSRQDRRL